MGTRQFPAGGPGLIRGGSRGPGGVDQTLRAVLSRHEVATNERWSIVRRSRALRIFFNVSTCLNPQYLLQCGDPHHAHALKWLGAQPEASRVRKVKKAEPPNGSMVEIVGVAADGKQVILGIVMARGMAEQILRLPMWLPKVLPP